MHSISNNFSRFSIDFSNGRLRVSDSNLAEDLYGSNLRSFDFPFGKLSTIKQNVYYSFLSGGEIVRHFHIEADGNDENICNPYDEDKAILFASWKKFPSLKQDLKEILVGLVEEKRKEIDCMLKILDGIDSAQDIDTSDNEPDFEKFLEETEPHYDRTEADYFPIFDLIDYARKVIKGRWASAEAYMLKRPFLINHMNHYAEEVIKGHWPELEELKKKHPEFATDTEE